ncbi:C2 domain-containing protein [Priestia megaterium]|uniref:hypothetical protein n=1 Tax=Priestia megaterium TaxID=1404 RepID=UPI001652A0D2|nr:hypothetical protein [Priestia megaterium]
MKVSGQRLEKLLGADLKARHKKGVVDLDQYVNLIIHKQIHGDKVYFPLNLDRVWNQIS